MSITKNEEETQYLQLIKDILKNGVQRPDRTGIGTLSVFGRTMRFSLRNNTMPIMTTKKVFWRGIVEELLWFISGSTNVGDLESKKVFFWSANVQANPWKGHENDAGPIYGFQWRASGATYKGMHHNYRREGVDQLLNAINTIKTNPYSRRILVCSWNPSDLHSMSLMPCHVIFQFYVANGELSCSMYQRAADVGLGVPFNIVSYALLTRMVAQVCGLQPGEFVWTGGDVHIYNNHVEPLNRQVKREPYAFPTVRLNPLVKDIEKFTFSDFTLENYKYHPSIKMEMAV